MYYFYGCGSTRILEKLMCRSCGLYLTTIRIIESNKVLEMISWILTHIGFDTTAWDIQVVIWWSVYWKPHTDILFIELIEAWIKRWFKEGRKTSLTCQRTEHLMSKFRRPVDNYRRPVDRLQNVPPTGRLSWRPVDQKSFSTFSDEQFVATSSPYDQIFMV